MVVSQYVYESLAAESSFRLFRVEKQKSSSDRFSTELQINLFESRLEDAPEYEAVSYAWCQESSTSSVICNGYLLPVTPNVKRMLYDLQRADSVGTFWIDSICINQASIPEKNTQVPKMRSIYREARLVWVWLGEESYEIKTTFEFLSEISKNLDMCASANHDHGSLIPEIQGPHKSFKEKICKARGFYDAVDTNFIVDVINLPWFHRTWTIQELALSKKAHLICGSIYLPWSVFIKTLQKLQVHELHEGNLDSISNPASFYDDTECYRTFVKFLQSPEFNLTISTTLKLARPKSSTDRRDKVYGLYGILNQKQIPGLPEVDYHQTVQDVYTRITTAAIQAEKSLDILYQVCLQPLIPDLPSWVPDWSNTAFFRPILVQGSCAAGSSTASYHFSGQRLSVSGILIDEIRETATSTSVAMGNFRRGWEARTDSAETSKRLSGVMQLVPTLQSWIRLSRKLQSYPTGISPLDAFYHIIMQNSILSFSGPQKASLILALDKWTQIITTTFPESSIDLQTLHEEVRCIPEYTATLHDYSRRFGCSTNLEAWPDALQLRFFLRLHSPDVALVQHEIFLNSYHKTFFTTRDGYMGTCPRWARPGDAVALVAGLEVAFIVRKDGKCFRLIGPAYMHGVMKGERWDEGRLMDITLV